MAGTVAKHADRGDEVYIVICTLGIGGASGDPRIREEEAMKASRILGARLLLIDYPVIKLNRHSSEFTDILRRKIQGILPDRIYTHGLSDYHQVHEAVSRSTLDAASDVHQILFYEEASSTSPDFRPNAYVDITDYMHLKLQSLKSHSTQAEKLYIQENITRALAHTRYILGKIGTRRDGMAEAFSIFRFLVTETDVNGSARKKESTSTHSQSVLDSARQVTPA
jgi:LmbE family N-acetylglucosaminyl deacetylase